MRTPAPLPAELGTAFTISDARAFAIGLGRLRGADLAAPFRGVRMRSEEGDPQLNMFARALREELQLIRALALRDHPTQFFSHRSAALLWGAPMPHAPCPDLHLSAFSPLRAPRVAGVRGHCLERARFQVDRHEGIALTSPASTWVTLGHLPLTQLVAAGDYFVRVYRSGYGRQQAGMPPLATREELRAAVALGRWPGAPRLRRALALIREDSWSPRESAVRVILAGAGFPEPELNRDVFDRRGTFLACLDLAFFAFKVAVEYHGQVHADRYAEDVERVERLRAEGWIIIQITRALMYDPQLLVQRVAQALRLRGWDSSVRVAVET